VSAPFTWRDGERTLRFGSGTLAEAPGLLAEHGFDSYALLTTERARVAPARAAVEALEPAATDVLLVPAGRVDDVSAALLDAAGERPLVAVGGGRVIDTAKAIAGAVGTRCAALPTTLSGAELTRSHRRPRGAEGASIVRPALVIADPPLMTSQPPALLAASAMNALAHALEALYTPLANPVCDMAALVATRLLASGLEAGDHDQLALGALLAGYACGCTGVAVHHAICQTIVRTAGTPHAETNAVMLPHSARLLAGRAPRALGAFAAALGDPAADPQAAAGRVAPLAARSGHTRLRTLGVGEEHVEPVVAAVLRHPLYGNTPEPPNEDELRALLRNAL
jgi:alcohol dehydrogenase class IV